MCGRFTLSVEADILSAYFGLDNIPFPYEPRYNIAPGQPITAVISHQGKIRIGMLRWGLIPPWAKDAKIANKLINARAETLLDKPSFRRAAVSKRCVIPADGFFEWKKSEGRKQPMRIVTHERLFVMAGLYEQWISPEGEKIFTCTIITTNANSFMSGLHHRMPVILERDQLESWLTAPLPEAMELLQPYNSSLMDAYPVTTSVGKVTYNQPDCIVPLTESNN